MKTESVTLSHRFTFSNQEVTNLIATLATINAVTTTAVDAIPSYFWVIAAILWTYLAYWMEYREVEED